MCWIDPARDDMLVEKITRELEEDGGTVGEEWRTHYLDYDQLPNGQWYPTKWRWSYVTNDKKGNPKYDNTRESHLRIYPDVGVDEDWFTNPAERLKAAGSAE